MTKSLARRVAALLVLIAASPIFAAEFERPIDDAASQISADNLAVPALDASQLTPNVEALPGQSLEAGHGADFERDIPVAAQVLSRAAASGADIDSATAIAPSAVATDFGRPLESIKAALQKNGQGGAAPGNIDGLNQLFTGRAVGNGPGVNAEGILLYGRAAADYEEVKALQAAYKGKIDFSESIDVMDDAYSEAYAKIAILQALAGRKKTRENSTRLDATLQRVDGIINDGGRSIAVASQQVFFHHAQNPQSEIAEGIRRVGSSLASALRYFAPGGKADRQFGRLDEIVLGFDTRGYPEIKADLQEKAKNLANASPRPVRFVYLDDVAPVPQGKQQVREALNALIKRHKSDPGLSELMGGVIHSRYTGLLLELKTLAHYYDAGYQILQSGREFFDANGFYVTELDAVVRSPEGKTILVEAKSSRDFLPPNVVLKDKVEYKLRTYQARRAELEAWIGHPIDEVVFSVGVGRNYSLKPYLEAQREALSHKYGFPVDFLFIDN